MKARSETRKEKGGVAMKAGKTLPELAKTLSIQREQSRDFVANTTVLEATPQREIVLPVNSQNRMLNLTDIAHEQISSRLQIPRKYYDRLNADAPELWAKNLNHWFHADPQNRMLRTFENGENGTLRAFLSNRYRPLDNWQLAEYILPELSQPGLKIASCEITDRRMYIKAVSERICGEIKKGDVVQSGVCISNSEVGCGSVSVEPLLYRLVCANGLIMQDLKMRKYHTGRGFGNGGDENGDAEEFFRDETRRADDKAFFLKTRDLVRGALSQSGFNMMMKKISDATTKNVVDPVKTIEITQRKLGWTDEEKSSVLKHLIDGGDLSLWGLTNAVTRAAQDIDSYDRATDFERMGSAVLELPKTDWN